MLGHQSPRACLHLTSPQLPCPPSPISPTRACPNRWPLPPSPPHLAPTTTPTAPASQARRPVRQTSTIRRRRASGILARASPRTMASSAPRLRTRRPTRPPICLCRSSSAFDGCPHCRLSVVCRVVVFSSINSRYRSTLSPRCVSLDQLHDQLPQLVATAGHGSARVAREKLGTKVYNPTLFSSLCSPHALDTRRCQISLVTDIQALAPLLGLQHCITQWVGGLALFYIPHQTGGCASVS